MTAAAGRVVAGGATQAEKDALARRLAAARTQQAAPAPPAPAKPATPAPPAPDRRPRPPAPPLGGRGAGLRSGVDTGAGFLLGLLVWGWVVLPFVQGGPAQVKKVLYAKFLNKTPDGKWLP